MAVNEHDGRPNDAEARIAQLYREAARELPARHIDEMLAAAARKPAGEPVRKPSLWWLKPLHVPIAVAAIGIVAWSLIALMMREDRERVVSAPPVSTRSPAADAAAEKSAPQSVPQIDAYIQSAPGIPDMPSRDVQTMRVPDAAPDAPPQPPGSREKPAEIAASAPSKREQPARSEDRAARTPPPATAPSTSEQPPKLEDRPAQALASPSVALERQKSRDLQEVPNAARAQAAPPGESALPPPVAGAGPAGAEAVPRPQMRMERRSGRAAVGGAVDASSHVAELEHRPPGDWLDRVRLLRRDGRLAEAKSLLAEFRRRYPNELVPADLQ